MTRKFRFLPLLISLGAGWAFFVMMPVIQHDRDSRERVICASSLRQLGLATHMYFVDYTDMLPSVSFSTSGAFGWAGALGPYVKNKQVFQCPSTPWPKTSSNPRALGYTDFWINQRLSGRPLKELAQPPCTILLGEGNDGIDATDARYALDSLPASWRTDENSPSYRHMGGANYLYVDGHADWRKPDAVEDNAKPDGNRNSTFALK